MLMNTGDKPVRSEHGLITTIAWGLGDGVQYALEGACSWPARRSSGRATGRGCSGKRRTASLMRAGSIPRRACTWCRLLLDLAPYWNSDVRGAVFGLTRGTSKEHFIRATLESLAYQTRDVLSVMEEDSGYNITSLRVDGGAVSNTFLMEFQSDILNVPVERPNITETTALGAAYLAGSLSVSGRTRRKSAKKWSMGQSFKPTMEEDVREQLYSGWKSRLCGNGFSLAFSVV